MTSARGGGAHLLGSAEIYALIGSAADHPHLPPIGYETGSRQRGEAKSERWKQAKTTSHCDVKGHID